MTRLELTANQKVRENLANFERFLSAYDLKILARRENAAKGTIELTIDANFYEQARWVSGLAFDFFETGLIGLTTDFSAATLKQAA